ncbi:MAG: hypothetical protein AAF928_18320, partial [Myxococcota bacterium]
MSRRRPASTQPRRRPSGERDALRRRQFGLAVLALGSLGAAACSGVGRTHVEQGERVDTGRSQFDNYFREVVRYRERVDAVAGDDLFSMREPLVEQLDVEVDAGLGELLSATRARVEKVRGYGVRLSLYLAPGAELEIVRGDVAIDDEDESLIEAIEASAKVAATSFADYSALLEEGSDLERRRATLADKIDGLPRKFAAKTDLMEDEIVGAGRVLRASERALLAKTQVVSHFLLGLSSAV